MRHGSILSAYDASATSVFDQYHMCSGLRVIVHTVCRQSRYFYTDASVKRNAN